MKNQFFVFLFLLSFSVFAQENKPDISEVQTETAVNETSKIKKKEKKKRLLKRRVIATFYEDNHKIEVVYNRLFDFYYAFGHSGKPKKKLLRKIEKLEDLFAEEPFKSLMLSANYRILVTEGTVRKNHYRIYHNFDEPDNFSVYKVKDGIEELYETINEYELETKKPYRKLVSREI